MALVDLPFHATVVKRLGIESSVKEWMKENPLHPVVDRFKDLFVWQCVQFDRGKFPILKHQLQLVKDEMQKQADEESFARDATL